MQTVAKSLKEAVADPRWIHTTTATRHWHMLIYVVFNNNKLVIKSVYQQEAPTWFTHTQQHLKIETRKMFYLTTLDCTHADYKQLDDPLPFKSCIYTKYCF